MGRTLPTIIHALRAERDGWSGFRRALRREDQEAFDAVWRDVRRHAAPASMASRPMPFEAALMGMIVGLQRRVMDLESRLAAPESVRPDSGDKNDGGQVA